MVAVPPQTSLRIPPEATDLKGFRRWYAELDNDGSRVQDLDGRLLVETAPQRCICPSCGKSTTSVALELRDA